MIFLDLSFVVRFGFFLWVWLGFFLNFLDLSFDVRFEFCCCGLGLCWILFLGSTSCNFSNFWVCFACFSCSRFE